MVSRPSEPALLCLRGRASAAELAAVTAVLAALTRREPDIPAYERWRRGRLAAVGAKGSIRAD
jgi:hypothetical protein